MSALKEPTITDLDQASAQMKELMFKRPDLEDQIKMLRQYIVEMKVALSELGELREENIRGNITEDAYHVRRKKLKTDYMLAREGISDLAINNLLNEIKEPNEKSRLSRIKETIRSNKDTILFIMEVGSTLLKSAVGQK